MWSGQDLPSPPGIAIQLTAHPLGDQGGVIVDGRSVLHLQIGEHLMVVRDDGASTVRFGLQHALRQRIETCVPGFVHLVKALQPTLGELRKFFGSCGTDSLC